METPTARHYQLSNQILIQHWPGEDNAIAFHSRSSNIFNLDPYTYSILSLIRTQPLTIVEIEACIRDRYHVDQPEQLHDQLYLKLDELIDSDLVEALDR